MRLIAAAALIGMSANGMAGLSDITPFATLPDGTVKAMKSQLLPEVSASGRYVFTVDALGKTSDGDNRYVLSRMDRAENKEVASAEIITSGEIKRPVTFATDAADQVFFRFVGSEPLIENGTVKGSYQYDFNTGNLVSVDAAIGTVMDYSASGKYLLFSPDEENIFIRDTDTNTDQKLELTPTDPDKEKVNVRFSDLDESKVTDVGSVVVTDRSDSGSGSDYKVLQFGSSAAISIKEKLADYTDFRYAFHEFRVGISENGRYVALTSANAQIGDARQVALVDVFNDTVNMNVSSTRYALPPFIFKNTLSDTGVLATYYVEAGNYNNRVIAQDLTNNTLIYEAVYAVEVEDTASFIGISRNAEAYTLIKKVPDAADTFSIWKTSAGEPVAARKIVIKPESLEIDPYLNPNFTVNVNTEGEMFAADMICMSQGPAAQTSVDYGSWGDEGRLQLPLQVQQEGDATQVRGTLSQKAPAVAVSGEQQFMQMNYQAQLTTADVVFACEAQLSDANGIELEHQTQDVTVRLDDGIHGGSAVISGSINIPGVSDLSGVTVKVTINGRTIDVTPNSDGSFEFDNLRDGDFTVSVVAEQYVQSCLNTEVTGGNSVNLGNIELLAGDINNDNEINIADFTYLAGRYGSSVGDDRFDVKADLNKDGEINIQDLAILGSHFGSVQCNP